MLKIKDDFFLHHQIANINAETFSRTLIIICLFISGVGFHLLLQREAQIVSNERTHCTAFIVLFSFKKM